MIELWWLPLGAGGHCVKSNGAVFEALTAARQGRPRQSLYHAALTVTTDAATYAIEMGPVWNVTAPERGVVVTGPVGARWLGRWRLFRYEVRCWRDGVIPDLAEAVGGPVVVSDDEARSTALLDTVHEVPALVWGRDELGAGEMWNSNSLVAWLLATTGHDVGPITPPAGGRAPGWSAGLYLARGPSAPAPSRENEKAAGP